MTNSPCFKCSGTGYVSFKHICNGVCFQCGGTGTLTHRAAKAPFVYQDKPGYPVLPEGTRSTVAQWEYLERVAGGSDDKCRKAIHEAGCPYATSVYVSKAVMSRAIEIAKRGEA